MRKKYLPLAAIAGLTFSFATPIAAQAQTVAPDNLAITLTTHDSHLSATARGGLNPNGDIASGVGGAVALSASPDDTIAREAHEKYTILSSPIAVDDPFAVAGVTWPASETLPADATIEMRTLDGTQWSDWYSLEVADDSDNGEARSGTDYMVSGASTGIQVRVTHTDGELPADMRIDISYSPDSSTRTDNDVDEPQLMPSAASYIEEAHVDELSNVSASPVSHSGMVQSAESVSAVVDGVGGTAVEGAVVTDNADIRPRSAWGANENWMQWRPSYVNFEGVVIHHTAGSNTYTRDAVPAVLQGVYNYHANTLGWGDIGYNVLIDKFGGRWEGRYGTLASPARQMVIGGHARPRNQGTLGVSVMGDYTKVTVASTPAILTALEEVSAWRFIKAKVNPASTSPLTVPDTSYKLAHLRGAPMPRIVGHMDVSATSCPGNIYDYLPHIRARVQSLYDAHDYTKRINQDKAKLGSSIGMYRLYNYVTSEHLYTRDVHEALVLVKGDWRYEGIAWIAPASGTPVYRLYNAASGEHHYTLSTQERNNLVANHGWKNEGVAWYSHKGTNAPVYRQYNATLPAAAQHHYTADKNEYNVNNGRGWNGEGVAWYALRLQ